jgi:hypothetical protein
VTKSEMAKVLAKIQLGDNRQVDALVLEEWFDTLGHLSFEDAVEAVRLHRLSSTDWLTPAHVAAGVRKVKADRNPSNDTTPIEARAARTAPKPSNWEAMCAAYKNPAEFARQVAVYDEQLVAAGFERVGDYRWK